MPARTLKYLPLDELRGHPDNPKNHHGELIGASIDRFGYVEPQVLDERTGLLAAGHGRLDELRAKQADGAKVPDGIRVVKGRWLVPVVHGWSSADDREALAYLVASNQSTIAGGWDLPQLGSVLDDISITDAGWDGIGFDTDSLDDLIAAGTPTMDPWSNRTKREMPDAAGFVGGQVWQVGDHRVIVGDARDPSVWDLVPPCDLLVTDPPYGIGYSGGGIEREVIEDDEDPMVAAALLGTVLDQVAEHVTPGAPSYVFLPGGVALPVLLAVVHDRGLHRWSIVWAKDQATFGRADYHQQHEHISYGWFPGPRRVPVEDRTLTTLWEVPRPRASEHHPTEKPVELIQRAVEASSHPGDVVVDPFAGSGSTLLAAAATDRIGVGIESVPAYAKVTVDRLAAATGAAPEMVAGNP